MNVLLVCPQYPDTYWSFKHALKFVSKKAAHIPLGLITVASLLPREWNKRLIDLNTSVLRDADITWADYVFIGAMAVQSVSANQIIDRCILLNVKTVAGGPLFTEEFEKYDRVDYLILNEAEITLPRFLQDLQNNQPKKKYQSEEYADITRTPLPDYSLLTLKHYNTASLQYSRGCPFNCEFCDITALYGRQVRTKTPRQIIEELELLLYRGWKGNVFFVDDNFIGHRNKLKTELLPQVIQWMEANRYPFVFHTEASINLADDMELMQMMVKAGFIHVFVGIETPEESSLTSCNKLQNKRRDLIRSVKKIQQSGMEVSAGFIVGFDTDPPNIFQRQVDFIHQSGIITAMVGLLNAPRLSNLYLRLKAEGRILSAFSGDNTDFSMNFKPVMDKNLLLEGYRKIIRDIYNSKSYYKRVLLYLKQYELPSTIRNRFTFNKFLAFLKSVVYLGLLKGKRRYFWSLILWSLFRKPKNFQLAVTYAIYGYHFRKVFEIDS
jgi:radical SAM superfamily enzyme YgiQ (UPF0313 family)